MNTQIYNQNLSELFDYPRELGEIFDFLIKNNAKPIIVGGFVRDRLLGIKEAKDIDVEVYNITSYKKLIELLRPFGSTSLVGESFGVCKVRIDDIECDFSLPRKETKFAKGHKGFHISIDSFITFEEASRRRDFTINAMGYDVASKTLLDCYGGYRDLQNKTLRAVNEKTFLEDPLRILRAAVFIARFRLHPDDTLLKLCLRMIADKMLKELPKERVFEEFKKLFLKSPSPSKGIEFLHRIKENIYLKELFGLEEQPYRHTLQTFDRLAQAKTKRLSYYFAALLIHIDDKQSVLERFTNDKKIFKETFAIIKNQSRLLTLLKNGYNGFGLKNAAKFMDIGSVLEFLKALYPQLGSKIEKMKKDAKNSGVLHRALPPLINGKDLIKLGLKPSKQFKTILEKIYLDQLKGEKIDDLYLKKIVQKYKKN